MLSHRLTEERWKRIYNSASVTGKTIPHKTAPMVCFSVRKIIAKLFPGHGLAYEIIAKPSDQKIVGNSFQQIDVIITDNLFIKASR